MVMGMAVVFVYLVLMIVLIDIFKKLLAPLVAREKENLQTPPKSSGARKSDGDDAQVTAAVTAAIQTYRKSRK